MTKLEAKKAIETVIDSSNTYYYDILRALCATSGDIDRESVESDLTLIARQLGMRVEIDHSAEASIGRTKYAIIVNDNTIDLGYSVADDHHDDDETSFPYVRKRLTDYIRDHIKINDKRIPACIRDPYHRYAALRKRFQSDYETNENSYFWALPLESAPLDVAVYVCWTGSRVVLTSSASHKAVNENPLYSVDFSIEGLDALAMTLEKTGTLLSLARELKDESDPLFSALHIWKV